LSKYFIYHSRTISECGINQDENGTIVQVVKGDMADWLTKPFDDFPSDSALGLKNKFAYTRIKLDASNEQIKKDFAGCLCFRFRC